MLALACCLGGRLEASVSGAATLAPESTTSPKNITDPAFTLFGTITYFQANGTMWAINPNTGVAAPVASVSNNIMLNLITMQGGQPLWGYQPGGTQYLGYRTGGLVFNNNLYYLDNSSSSASWSLYCLEGGTLSTTAVCAEGDSTYPAPSMYAVTSGISGSPARLCFIWANTLYISDGTASGTATFPAGIGNTISNVTNIVPIGPYLYFSADMSGAVNVTQGLFRILPGSLMSTLTRVWNDTLTAQYTLPAGSFLTTGGNFVLILGQNAFSQFDGSSTTSTPRVTSTTSLPSGAGTFVGVTYDNSYLTASDSLYVQTLLSAARGLYRYNFAAITPGFSFLQSSSTNPVQDMAYIPGATPGTGTLFYSAPTNADTTENLYAYTEYNSSVQPMSSSNPDGQLGISNLAAPYSATTSFSASLIFDMLNVNGQIVFYLQAYDAVCTLGVTSQAIVNGIQQASSFTPRRQWSDALHRR